MAMRRARRILGAGLTLATLIIAAGANAASNITPSASVTTLMAGWERYFSVKWSEESEVDGTHRIQGYVSSQHGVHAVQVRLLAQALEPSGTVVAQRITWVPGGVPGLGQAYFEIPRLPAADHYRVSVWDYTFHQSPSIP
jgi:hypothetical protein